ncbi:MAG: hypothetical protein ACI82A_001475 [Candidatus Azotimanducaceae bacterium]|jgi:hypothetical protein
MMKTVWILMGLMFALPIWAEAETETSVTTLTPEQLENYRFQVQPTQYEAKELSIGQQSTMSSKRRAARDLLARQLGIVRISGTREDLSHLQQLVDRKILRKSQREEWQTIGILFGDILAKEFRLDWVSYKDERGANKALRYRKTDNFIFPVTLFSKRVKFDEEIDMVEIYASLEAEIQGFIAWESKNRLPKALR